MKYKNLLRGLLMAAGWLGAQTAAIASFTGVVDAALWTTTVTADSNASATFSADGSTLTLVSTDLTDPDSGLWGVASSLETAWTASSAITLSFHWSYTSVDDNGSTQDPFGYAVDGVYTALSADGGWAAQQGDVTLSLAKGQTFSFRADSTDSIFGAATTVISGVSAVSAVPEPAGHWMALGGLAALGALRRRQRRA
jgi:hypothetical protein